MITFIQNTITIVIVINTIWYDDKEPHDKMPDCYTNFTYCYMPHLMYIYRHKNKNVMK